MTKMISVAEAARITGLSTRQVSHLCQIGRIEGAQLVGKTYIIPEEWAVDLAAIREATVSIKEAAEQAGVSRIAIAQAARSGRLDKVGSRITRDSLNRYIEKRALK